MIEKFIKYLLSRNTVLKHNIFFHLLQGREIVSVVAEGKEVYIPDNAVMYQCSINNCIVQDAQLNLHRNCMVTSNTFKSDCKFGIDLAK